MISTSSMPATITHRPHCEDELVEEVRSALRRTGYLELYGIDVRVDGRDVLLRGHVPSYFLKQKAESVTRGIPNVCILKSDIEVI